MISDKYTRPFARSVVLDEFAAAANVNLFIVRAKICKSLRIENIFGVKYFR